MIDLHVHSNRSDGTFTPTELVDYAIKKGLSAFALTDHDTVEGIEEALSYAESLRSSGVANVPEVIPGIELSTALDKKDVHIVGLYVDYRSDALKEHLKEFVDSRDRRNRVMCERFQKDGYEIIYEELLDRFPGAIPTRAHVATMLLEKGYVKSKTEAFERFIGDHCPYYIPRERITPEEGVDFILRAGGIPVLAHPILYRLSKDNLDALVGRLKSHGLIGIEAVYSTYSPSEERQIRELAKKYDLRISGGSDFHGSNKDNIDLGTGLGRLYIDDSIHTGFNEARKNLLFTDMDGTLLLNDSTISIEMKTAIESLTEHGHKFVFTSGRPLPSILERINLFGLKSKNTYVIANNGALIYDLENELVLLKNKISPAIIEDVVKICDEMGIHIHSFTEKEIIGTGEDRELEFYMQRIHMPFIRVSSLSEYLSDGAFKCQIISLDNHDALVSLKAVLEEKLGDKIDLFFSSDKYLEVLPKGTNKGNAVMFLTDKLAMLRTHTFAAGDANNDIPMLNAASFSIAVANATDEVKNVADIVTQNDNNHDGLLEIIYKYF